MGVMERLSLVFKAKANKVLDDAEDPHATYDLAVAKQRENLLVAQRALAKVATALESLREQDQKLARRLVQLKRQAATAVGQGRDDLATEALTRAASVQAERDSLAPQLQQLATQQQQLETGVQRLRVKVDAFSTHAVVAKASLDAATASSSAAEIITGLSEEGGDLGLAVQRADDKVAAATARSAALGDLMASGKLGDVTGAGGADADLDAQIAALDTDNGVAAQLAALKASALRSGVMPIASGSSASSDEVVDITGGGTGHPARQHRARPRPPAADDEDGPVDITQM